MRKFFMAIGIVTVAVSASGMAVEHGFALCCAELLPMSVGAWAFVDNLTSWIEERFE